MFAAISAIGGLALRFYCVPWRVIVIPNLIIAIVSAIVSLDQNFSFLAGFAFVFGYILASIKSLTSLEQPLLFSQKTLKRL